MKTRRDVIAAYTVLAAHHWTLLLRTPRGALWQWRTGQIILVPHNPQGRSWWPALWDQAWNIMHGLSPIPESEGQMRRVTLTELVRHGFAAEAQAWTRAGVAVDMREAA